MNSPLGETPKTRTDRAVCDDCGKKQANTRGLCGACYAWSRRHPAGQSRREWLAAREREKAEAALRDLERHYAECGTCGRLVGRPRVRDGVMFCDAFCTNHWPPNRERRGATTWFPEVKAKMDARLQEAVKQRKHRRKRPDVRARELAQQAAYRARPEVRERRLAANKRHKAAHKEHRREVYRAYYARKKAEREAQQQAEGAESGEA